MLENPPRKLVAMPSEGFHSTDVEHALPTPPADCSPPRTSLLQERPLSASRRMRPSERALAGADKNKLWPHLHKSVSLKEHGGPHRSHARMQMISATNVELDTLVCLPSVSDGCPFALTPQGPNPTRHIADVVTQPPTEKELQKHIESHLHQPVPVVPGMSGVFPVENLWLPEIAQGSGRSTIAAESSGSVVSSSEFSRTLLAQQDIDALQMDADHGSANHEAYSKVNEHIPDTCAAAASNFSQDAERSEGTVTIRRRYFSELTRAEPPRMFEVILVGSESDSSCKDYLTWYYCDFLEAAPVGPAPPFSEENTTTADALIEWLREFKPRTRLDAYPMLQVAIVALNKLVQNEVRIRSHQTEELIRLNRDLQQMLQAKEEAMEGLMKHIMIQDAHRRQLEDNFAALTSRIGSNMNQQDVLKMFEKLQQQLEEEKLRYSVLEGMATALKKEAFDATGNAAGLAAQLMAREQQIKRLQELAKKKELENLSLQESVQKTKMVSLLVKIANMSLSSYWKVWKDLAVKHRALRLQAGRTLVSLAVRRDRLRINISMHGWWEETLLGRKTNTVRTLVRHHMSRQFFSQLICEAKMSKVGRSLMQVGLKEESQRENLRLIAWREWNMFARHHARLRKAVSLLLDDHNGRTMKVVWDSWRSSAAAALLLRAGFGVKSNDKGLKTRPALVKSSSTERFVPAMPQSARRRESVSSLGQSSVSPVLLGRTRSASIQVRRTTSLSRTPSFHSIIESDCEQSATLPNAVESLRLQSDNHSVSSSNSASSVTSPHTMSRVQSTVAMSEQERQVAARAGVGSEAFLQTLLKKGGSFQF